MTASGNAQPYLFVNKSAQSTSLSQSNDSEKFNLQSHAHSNFHRIKPRSKAVSRWQSVSSAERDDDQRAPPERQGDGQHETSGHQSASLAGRHPFPRARQAVTKIPGHSYMGHPQSRRIHSPSPFLTLAHEQIDGMTIDPFFCTRVPINSSDHHLLSAGFTSLLERIFEAESLSANPGSGIFRHAGAIQRRLEHCVVDDLTMYSTLLYSASLQRWALGLVEKDRPPEYWMGKAIPCLRTRLQHVNHVDCDLVLAIHALAVAELWSENYLAATAHLRMIRHLVHQKNNIKELPPLAIESLLMCDHYLAVANSSRPVFHQDWDPRDLTDPSFLQHIQSDLSKLESHCGEGFVEAEAMEIFSPTFLSIVRDAVYCVHVAKYARSFMVENPSSLHQWLFIHRQHVLCRLLALVSLDCIEDCSRLALAIWLLQITECSTPQKWIPFLIPRLYRAFLLIKTRGQQEQKCPASLQLWLSHVGASSAEDEDTRDWFRNEMRLTVLDLGPALGQTPLHQVFERYFFLPTESNSRYLEEQVP